MDYEKKYKEALERARKRVATEPQDHTDAILKDIFPELRESEDEGERIRRKMIKHFKAKTKEKWCNMPVKDIIAWLEKQKDNKFAPRVLPCSAAWFEDGEEKQKEQKPETLTEVAKEYTIREDYTSAYYEQKGYSRGYADGKKDAEQKPVSISCGHENDKPLDNWKPSEEQMAALEAATVRYQSTGLESLYEDLKKL